MKKNLNLESISKSQLEKASFARGSVIINYFMLKNPQTSSTHRHSFLRFILIFATLIIVFYATTFTPTFNNSFFPAYLKFQAKISSSTLNMLGENTHVTGTSISSAKFAVNMVWGCDALEPSALFIAAVLAFPAPVLLKIT